MHLIELQDLHKTYHMGELDVTVLKGISLTIEQGALVEGHFSQRGHDSPSLSVKDGETRLMLAK